MQTISRGKGPISAQYEKHRVTLECLKDAVGSGRTFCHALLHYFYDQSKADSIYERVFLLRVYTTEIRYTPKGCHIYKKKKNQFVEMYSRRELSFTTYQTKSRFDTVHRAASSHFESTSVDCEQTWATVRSWMDNCTLSHGRSGHIGLNGDDVSIKPCYPTRLVDISRPGFFRVIHVILEAPNGPYMMLDHCWGPLEFSEASLKLAADTH